LRRRQGTAEGAIDKRYIHWRPEYPRNVREGLESLYATLAALVNRPFKGRELIDQAEPDFLIEG
jgi:hypothetical protein